MPRLWSETIQAHRRDVREAILDATWALVTEHGPLTVTMSQIAQEAGIGRATLYKYFPDVQSILVAWHQRLVTEHLEQLAALRRKHGSPLERLEAVLHAYAKICHHRARHGTDELDALLHRDEHAADARQQLLDLFRDLLDDAGASAELGTDIATQELAHYCLHALGAAGSLPTEAAVRRLVATVLAGLLRT